MTGQRSPTLRIRASGEYAIFTRPEFKTERLSYPVPTPSAVRGIFEAILWKPAICWHIERIHVLNEIRSCAFKRNEVSTKGPMPTKSVITDGGPAPVYWADRGRNRAQRNTVALRDVDYVFEAHFSLTDKAGDSDSIEKFVAMFERRVTKGQHFHQPYFGCRECVARIEPVNGEPAPIRQSQDLGIMLWDIRFGTAKKEGNTPLFFRAKLDQGTIHVPAEPVGAGEEQP